MNRLRTTPPISVSVVIPTFNRLDRLRQALHSVREQTVLASEVIVVDDGSTDESAAMVREEFPEAALLRQPNRGVSAARNLGIKHCTEDWIAFLDSDDRWLPDKLAAQLEWIAASPDCRVCHTDEIWIRNGVRVNAKSRHRKPSGRIYLQCLPLCCVSPSSILLHREVLDTAGLFDESFAACEDYELWLRVFHKFDAGLVAQPLLQKYGGHPDQLSRKYWGMDRFRIRALEKMLQAGDLNDEEWLQTAMTLQQKCNVLLKGFERRGKTEDAEHVRLLMQKYSLNASRC